ncbi:hypothetical protein RCL_jg10242.t1 [Rhizophagus clarus]|uniref:Uncharacterized protein n=1 Tax=Rhizophagus clarus TaxID=94130 RepID=A0A8H3KUV6_9GLOM|nr:hypothetical protein RCL_jg10242.t1 [Rhizophagus clarus]
MIGSSLHLMHNKHERHRHEPRNLPATWKRLSKCKRSVLFLFETLVNVTWKWPLEGTFWALKRSLEGIPDTWEWSLEVALEGARDEFLFEISIISVKDLTIRFFDCFLGGLDDCWIDGILVWISS